MRIIKINSEEKTIQWKDIDGSLESLQAEVDGLIQPIRLSPNKDGYRTDVMVNEEAHLIKKFKTGFMLMGTFFLGNGIVVRTDLKTGDSVGIEEDELLDMISSEVTFHDKK